MLLLIESGIRRVIATMPHRYAKANNEYRGTEFDPTNESEFNSYLDANKHYGGQCLNNFQRLDLNGRLTMNLMTENIWDVSLKLI